MIIDVRTRVWSGRDPLANPQQSDHLAETARVGLLGPNEFDPSSAGHARAMEVVSAAIVAGWRSDQLGAHLAMEHVAAAVNDAPEGARIGFAGVDAGAPTVADDIERAVEQGMSGLTFSPADQAVRPTDDRALALLELAAARRLPVLVANPCLRHGASVLEFAQPALLDEACRTIPGLTLILGDVGATSLDETFLMLAKHDRVFAEISGVVGRPWSLYTTLLSAFERAVTHKLLFASGYPDESPKLAIERIYSVNTLRGGASALPAIPRETLRGIVERDSLSLLGIDAPAPSAARRARALDERARALVPAQAPLRSAR